MARRGLVSKSMGGPQSGGGSALMPKGEKPKGPELLAIGEVARRLNVDPSQVETWMQKDQLRGNDSGIRPYDYKKFQLDFREEIKRAQKESAQGKRTKSDRKPKKGFLSKFRSIFGGSDTENESPGASDGSGYAEENKKLKAEIKKLKKQKPGNSSGDSSDQEEKIRYLEGKLSENRALESENARLKKQLSAQPDHSATGQADPQLSRELEETRRDLEEAKRFSAEAFRFKEALAAAQQERDELQRALEERKNQNQGGPELESLQSELAQRAEELSKLQHRAQGVFDENTRLRAERDSAGTGEDPLVDELLDLQRRNLERFQRLHGLHQAAQEKLEELQKTDKPSPERDKDFRILKAKYKKLLVQKSQASPEVAEQLSSAKDNVSKLQAENEQLRGLMQSEAGADEASEKRIKELETKLKEAKSLKSSNDLADRELATLKKGLQVKENQVQKVASRLADNEKRLAKALQESGRLTELLIERENRLRELSTEFEEEYRDKMENLDRQVSGLQWKLSLREERIAHLESELLRKGD